MFEHEVVKTDEATGLSAFVAPDCDVVESPREWCNTARFVMAHGRYDVPDEVGVDFDQYGSWREIADMLVEEHGALLVVPVYMLDHSGVTVSTGTFACDPQGWDSGQVGLAVILPDRWREMMGSEEFTEERGREVIEGEVKTYAQYLEGDVWIAGVLEPCEGCGTEEVVESVCGFYGSSYAEGEAEAMLEHAVAVKLEGAKDAAAS